ncbi:MAG: CoA pyrophosphatase [Dehalococcoidia bacterium]|nr:CoA pyrophosphatase [Dehalococcoidia bacterium]
MPTQAMPATTVESAIRQALVRHRKRSIDDSSMARAGVLVLVYPKDGMPHMLFNKRSEHVEKHKGEIAFPGGGWESGDATILDTALRETWEEMSIDPADVTVLGELDDIITISDFVVTPYVGAIPGGYDFKPNIEVAEVVEVPLEAILNGRNLRDDTRLVNGRVERRATYAHNGHLIWGATGMMLEGFVRILKTIDDGEDLWKT